MARRISEKRYQKLIEYDGREKEWNELMAKLSVKRMFDPDQQERENQKREQEDRELNKEREQIRQQIDFEDELASASEFKEILELLDNALTKGENYAQGYCDGFWAGRELQEKYRRARDESIDQKYNELNKRWGTGYL